MTDRQPGTPIACTLTEKEHLERLDNLDVRLLDAYVDMGTTRDGYEFSFERTDGVLDALRSFVAAERECCAFATYGIELAPPYETVQLTIAGPEGTKAQFDGLRDVFEHTDGGDANGTPQRSLVRAEYADVADGSDGACCGTSDTYPELLGYDPDEIELAGGEPHLGLGCGNPLDHADLSRGETVLDLGSGGGLDCTLAAEAVGPSGHVIGVDMTPEMLARARAFAIERGASNVEYRLGEIEHLPVADATVDVVISNCVGNLSPDTRQVFTEAYRVLRPGGRLAISDIVSTNPLSDDLAEDPDAHAGCIAGGATIAELEDILGDAGFAEISVEPAEEGASVIREWETDRDVSDAIVPAVILARK